MEREREGRLISLEGKKLAKDITPDPNFSWVGFDKMKIKVVAGKAIRRMCEFSHKMLSESSFCVT